MAVMVWVMPFFELFVEIGYVIIAGVSTLYIHGQHVYMMFSFFRSMTTSSGEPAIELFDIL